MQKNPHLTEEQKRVLFEKGTEMPGTGEWLHETCPGVYTCVNCGTPLFDGKDKYESTTPGLIGWPSFAEAKNDNSVILVPDDTFGMARTEITCANCGGHLGHLFTGVDDHPSGKHYCVSSCSLDFTPKSD